MGRRRGVSGVNVCGCGWHCCKEAFRYGFVQIKVLLKHLAGLVLCTKGGVK